MYTLFVRTVSAYICVSAFTNRAQLLLPASENIACGPCLQRPYIPYSIALTLLSFPQARTLYRLLSKGRFLFKTWASLSINGDGGTEDLRTKLPSSWCHIRSEEVVFGIVETVPLLYFIDLDGVGGSKGEVCAVCLGVVQNLRPNRNKLKELAIM